MTYPADLQIGQAFVYAFNGQDNGIMGMIQLMPADRDIQEWYEFLFLCYWLWANCNT